MRVVSLFSGIGGLDKGFETKFRLMKYPTAKSS